MEKLVLNKWLERFRRDIGYKSAVIISGNVDDVMINENKSGKYESIRNVLISCLKEKGYNKIIKWDKIEGIDYSVSDAVDYTTSSGEEQSFNLDEDDIYDIDDDTNDTQKCYQKASDFFPYIFNILKNNKKLAIIIDYSEYIFGNLNSFSEQELEYLAILGKILELNQSYDTLSSDFDEIKNIVIILTKNSTTIPSIFYQHNSMISLMNVPFPGRQERERFIDDNHVCLNILQNIDTDKNSKDDLIDALDNFSLKEIIQIMKLSRQMEESMSFEKLINLFKYGEKISPWEELSKEKLERIEEELEKRVKGQEDAISKVKDVIIRAYTGFSGLQHSSKQHKPKGTLFFVGPTGVGKTELAKALAEFIFGDENACIRFDMSEYNHENSDQRLVGAPPGYVGYEAGGQLTNAVKEKPFCVLLFDEIEKAHGKILDKFLQILEDGRLTDGKGETVSFSETIIIFTSNLGAVEVDSNKEVKEIRKQFIEIVKNHFINELYRPELLNRIGDSNIIPFNYITDLNVFIKIAKLKFKTIETFILERYKAKIEFENEEEVFKVIAKKAGKQNGGRGLLNVMETLIINPLSEFIFRRMDFIRNKNIVIKLLYSDIIIEFKE